MNKQEFIANLKARLSGLPAGEIDARAECYGEMIDDRMEDGMTEEEAQTALVQSFPAQVIGVIETVHAQNPLPLTF